MISKKVAARAGWCTVSDAETVLQKAPAVLHCKLRVGLCELTADVHVVDEKISSEQTVPFDWHILLGQEVMKTLVNASWEVDICYVDGLCKRGQGSANSISHGIDRLRFMVSQNDFSFVNMPMANSDNTSVTRMTVYANKIQTLIANMTPS